MGIILIVIAWFAGIFLAANFGGIYYFAALGLAIPTIGLASFTRFVVTIKQLQHIFFVIGFFALGWFRYGAQLPTIDQNHIAFYNGGDEVTITGIVSDEPTPRERTTRLEVEVESITISSGTREVKGTIIVNSERFPVHVYGTRLRLTGKLDEPPQFETFNYRAWLARQGIHSVVLLPRVEVLDERVGNPIYHLIFDFKARAQETINRLIPEPEAALLSGILLGNEFGMPAELQEQFRVTGMTHIIAISGFNIAILMGVFMGLARPFASPRNAAFIAIAGIFIYTIFVGADASVVRAFIMGSIFLISKYILGRPTFSLASLFVAGGVMTLWNPFSLWDVGFQLSFAATAGLMVYADDFTKLLERQVRKVFPEQMTKRLMAFLAEGVAITLAAQLMTIPLMLYYFEQLSIASFIANPLILWAQPAVMTIGGLSTLLGMIILPLGQIPAWVAWVLLKFTTTLVRVLSTVPLAAIPVRISGAGVIALYIIILGATYLIKNENDAGENLWQKFTGVFGPALRVAAAAVTIWLILGWLNTQPDGDLHVHFLDVGAGEATFIQTPAGRQILIDGGPSANQLNDHLGRIMPFWDRDIDLIIATHPDDEHLTGLPGVFNRFRVGQLITNLERDDFVLNSQQLSQRSSSYATLLTQAQSQNIPIHTAQLGERINLGDGVTLEVLHPSAEPSRRQNNHALVLRLVYDELSVLLTSDIESDGEAVLLANNPNLHAQVWQLNNSGADNANSAAFLDQLHPRLAILSIDANNVFALPDQTVVDSLAARGIPLLRTDELGSIELISDGKQMWWQSWQQ